MRLPSTRIWIALGTVVSLVTFCAGIGIAQKKDPVKTPAELFPAETVAYLRVDGSEGHEETFAETAAYQALYDSGLMEIFENALNQLSENEETAGLAGIVEHLKSHGFSAAIAVNAPADKPIEAWGTVVVPFAGPGVDLLEDVLTQLSEGKAIIKQTKVKKRVVKFVQTDNPLVELAWWSYGENLVICAGMNAVANSMAVADDERPNLTSHRLWEQYSNVEDDFDVVQTSWFDFQSLRDQFGGNEIPLSQETDAKKIKVNELLEILGLHNLNHAATLAGYRGESLWSEAIIDAPGERTGLLSLIDQPSFAVEDLPAMPLNHHGLLAFSFDGNKAYETILKLVRDLVALSPEDKQEEIDQGLEKFEEELGFSPETLLGSLGNLHCVYSDSTQSLFGLGTVGLVQVKDQSVLTDCLRKLLNRLAEEAEKNDPGAMIVEELEGEERSVFRLRFPKVSLLTPTFSIDEEWMIVGLIPQSVEAQVMRFDGTLFSWSIEDDLGKILETLPEEMTSLQIVDPAGTYKLLIGLAPTFLNLMEQGLIESRQAPMGWRLPIDTSSIPPAELVVQPLFTNVGVGTVSEEGWHAYHRQSLPGLPFAGGAGGSSMGIGVSAVSIALLLPAVQKARQAARISQNKNHLKQLGLSLHNYHDTFNHFPAGTVPNPELPVEERLSWLVSVLPYLDQAAVYQTIDQKKSWEADENKKAVTLTIPSYLDPNQHPPGEGPGGLTNYIGIGGLGPDGPTLPATDKRAGAFGYDRVTTYRDVRDGLSNTMFITTSTSPTRWAEGGNATVRPFTQQPYLNGPDQIGFAEAGSVQILMGDGSVRSISQKIDPKVVEALTTINGGEVVPDF